MSELYDQSTGKIWLEGYEAARKQAEKIARSNHGYGVTWVVAQIANDIEEMKPEEKP